MTWAPKHVPEILTALWQHLALCLASVFIGFIIALILGIACARRPKLYALVLTVADIIFVIPSLALFAMLIPLLGLGAKPAIVGLSSYTSPVYAVFRAMFSTPPTEWVMTHGNDSSASSYRWRCR